MTYQIEEVDFQKQTSLMTDHLKAVDKQKLVFTYDLPVEATRSYCTLSDNLQDGGRRYQEVIFTDDLTDRGVDVQRLVSQMTYQIEAVDIQK